MQSRQCPKCIYKLNYYLQDALKAAEHQLKELASEERALQQQAAEVQKRLREVSQLAPHAQEQSVQQLPHAGAEVGILSHSPPPLCHGNLGCSSRCQQGHHTLSSCPGG